MCMIFNPGSTKVVEEILFQQIVQRYARIKIPARRGVVIPSRSRIEIVPQAVFLIQGIIDARIHVGPEPSRYDPPEPQSSAQQII